MWVPDEHQGAIHEEISMLEKIKEEKKRIEDVLDYIDCDLKNRSFEGTINPCEKCYVLGQKSMLEDFVEFLEELENKQGDEKHGRKLGSGT